jgi:hypothetical protein
VCYSIVIRWREATHRRGEKVNEDNAKEQLVRVMMALFDEIMDTEPKPKQEEAPAE